MSVEMEMKALVKKRGSFKGQLTTFVDYLSSLEELDASQVRELQLRSQKIEQLYDQFDNVQLSIEMLTDDTSDVQMQERVGFESRYFSAIAKSQEIISSYNKSDEDLKSCSSDNSSNVAKRRLVRLPTIQLPKFSGSYQNWLEFKDTYCSLIHDNDDIDVVNKFHYLRSSLEGSAAIVLQSMSFSASNYDVAWKLLCDRFDNKQMLIQNHITSLFDIEPITKESSSVFKTLIDNLNKNLRSLEALGEPVKNWDTLLIYIVTRKLDSNTLREWEECKGRLEKSKLITFTFFVDFLRSRANVIETLELTRSSQSRSYSTSNKSKLKSMVSIQSDSSSIDMSSSSDSCPKCCGDHYLNTCPQFLSLSNTDRKDVLVNFKVCHNCFRPGHYSTHCRKSGCKICKRMHNTLIHIDMKSDRPNDGTYSVSPQVDVQPQSESSSHTVMASGNLTNVSLSAYVSATCEVLLSTALIKVYDAHNCVHVVRAVLDSGSTSCLMTAKLYNMLSLPVVCVDESIQGINNSLSQVSKMCRVRIMSLNDNYYNLINCFVLPSITDNVPSKCINISKLKYIPSDICLADPNFYKPAAIDLILGGDVFWGLLGSQRIMLGDGQPVLQETRLGWLVSGPINSGHSSSRSKIHCNFTQVHSNSDRANDFTEIQNQLMRFRQLEEISHHTSHSSEVKHCKEHVIMSMTRLENGRYCFKIPFEESSELFVYSSIRAKDCLLVCNSYLRLRLHIFSDASEHAYRTCEYARSENSKEVLIRLLNSHSRVAPIIPKR